MLRVLEHKLSQALPAPGRGNWFVGFNSFFGRDSGAPEAIYIEGYGALFLMKVDFPLSPPKVQEEEKEVKEEDADPVWEQMKQDMYAPERDVRIRRMTNRPEEEYDAEKVEKLKTTLIEALKHAANIRGLKPDESIILTITGSGESASQTVGMVSKTNKYVIVENDNSSGMASGYFSGDTEPSSPAVLVIRAKRSDIDAFSKGDLDYDQFGQKVQIFTCPYLGENIGGIPPGPAQRGREARGENRVRTERRR